MVIEQTKADQSALGAVNRPLHLLYARVPTTSSSTLHTGNALQSDADSLDLSIVLKHFVAHLAAPAGLLVASKRQGGVEDVVAIDPHGSSAQFCR
jgi:hypothetical protein